MSRRDYEPLNAETDEMGRSRSPWEAPESGILIATGTYQRKRVRIRFVNGAISWSQAKGAESQPRSLA
jgi:hypothetical protein